MHLRYREWKFWSPVLGRQAVRVSVAHPQGEFFAIIPADGTGKQNREQREKALDLIADAIEEGQEPGEVEVR